MKKILSKLYMPLAATVLLASCKKFDEINVNPTAANADQVQVEYFINNSIGGAQMDPHIAERIFVLYWEVAGHTSFNGTGLSGGSYNDGWTSDYYNGYISSWLNTANTAIQIANEKIASGNVKPYTGNLLQVARIWRAYLMSELTDLLGPIPINGFQGVNPEFSSVKDVYYFMLDELKDASSKLDVTVVNPSTLGKLDPAYGYNYTKWRKYANSLRLRLAMRLSEVDAAKAKSEFENAVAGDLITSADDMFQVAETGGWNSYTGVMSREWNPHYLTATLNTLYTGLGGVTSQSQLPASLQSYIKPANYIGQRYLDHFPTTTNFPMAGYWLDGLPYSIDPRAYKTYILPGDFTNPNFCTYPSWDNDAETTVRNLMNGSTIVKTIDAKYNWNAFPGGDWGAKGSNNQVRLFSGTIPRLTQQFRASTSKRIFFAPWETYFLIAEAAERGWSIPSSGQVAYENGIRASFDYWGVSSFVNTYLASTDYNRAGTSVNWNHTAEPGATYNMDYVDGYTNTPGVATINYPKNDLYKNGTVRNDRLTKIITQKFIAQTPWVPLEAWNDNRRLGLPFFENPVIENTLPNLPALTAGNYMTSNVQFFPQRVRYPSGLKNSNLTGYNQAVSLLGGPDEVLTPLWWAKH
ncbi:MAG: SusD/RagB family nutrient-binding outer membrane lipoprotein [Ferruginibacter sp.]|nr:SusD/RagB family nutrient-binding outer membrane lipoprotein [Ferruginibacter sp.]